MIFTLTLLTFISPSRSFVLCYYISKENNISISVKKIIRHDKYEKEEDIRNS